MSTDPKFRKCLTFDNKPMLLEIWDLTWFSCDEDSEGHAVVYFLSMLFSLIMRYRVKNRLRRTRCPATTGFSVVICSAPFFQISATLLVSIIHFHWDCLPFQVTGGTKKLSLEQLEQQTRKQTVHCRVHTQLTHSFTLRSNLSSWACVWTVGCTGEAGQNPKKHREKVKTPQGNHKNTRMLPH